MVVQGYLDEGRQEARAGDDITGQAAPNAPFVARGRPKLPSSLYDHQRPEKPREMLVEEAPGSYVDCRNVFQYNPKLLAEYAGVKAPERVSLRVWNEVVAKLPPWMQKQLHKIRAFSALGGKSEGSMSR
jgi:hypothetical protein